VEIDIPGFIAAISRKDIQESYRILKDANALPAVCGRVCPQEVQCEATCVIGTKARTGSRRTAGAFCGRLCRRAWLGQRP